MEANRFRQSVNRKWRIGIELFVARLARSVRRVEQLLRIGELGDDAVRSFEWFTDRHLVLLRMRLRFGQKRAHFEDRDHRQEPEEQEQQEEEESDRSEVHAPVPDRAV